MLGRPLGALLFGAAPVAPFAFDSLTFGANAATLLKMRKHYRHNRTAREPSARLLREIGEGFGWLLRDSFARIALPLTAGTTFVGQALIMFFLVQAHSENLSAAEIGIVLAGSGMGGVLGALAAPRLFESLAYGLLNWQLAGWVLTFTCLYLWGWHSSWCIALAMMFMSLTGALGNIALDNYIAQTAGPTLLGRVMSIYSLISFGALALGPLVGATLLSEHSPRHAVFALLITVLVLWALQPHGSHRKTREGYGAMFYRLAAARIALSLGHLVVARSETRR
jgi:Major Facilitator Superfamily